MNLNDFPTLSWLLIWFELNLALNCFHYFMHEGGLSNFAIRKQIDLAEISNEQNRIDLGWYTLFCVLFAVKYVRWV